MSVGCGGNKKGAGISRDIHTGRLPLSIDLKEKNVSIIRIREEN